MDTDPSEYTLENDPKRVQVADPTEYEPRRFSVTGEPIYARIGEDPS